MSTQAKLKQVTADLRAAHPELVQAGRWVFVTPLRHVQVGLLLDGSSDKTIFRPRFVLVPLFEYRSSSGWAYGLRLNFSIKFDDPAVGHRLVELYNQYITPLLPTVLDVEGFHSHVVTVNTVEYARKHVINTSAYNQHFRAYAMAALGRTDEAVEAIERSLMDDRARLLRLSGRPDAERIVASDIEKQECLRAVLRRTPTELAQHLREIELHSAQSRGIDKHWQPSPFPFETAASER